MEEVMVLVGLEQQIDLQNLEEHPTVVEDVQEDYDTVPLYL